MKKYLTISLSIIFSFAIYSGYAEIPNTVIKTDEQNQYEELHFFAEKGVGYTLQKSSDLDFWEKDYSFVGNGSMMKLRLFAHNANVLPHDGNDNPFLTVSASVRKVISGGTYITWISLEDKTVKRAYFPTVEIASNFPATYSGLKNGYYVFLSLEQPVTDQLKDADSPISGEDLSFKNALASILAGINNDSIAGNTPVRPHRPVANLQKFFWRLNTDPDLDSDGDGISNQDEIANGTDMFDEDTDNDGMPDENTIDSDGDGVADIHDADPLDKAIFWKKVSETPYSVTTLGSPEGVDLSQNWNIRLGEGGHVLLSQNTVDEWPGGSGAPDKAYFKTYVWESNQSSWTELALPDNLRGIGTAIDAEGNVYGRAKGALGENDEFPGFKDTSLIFKREEQTGGWAIADTELETELGTNFSDSPGTWTGIPSIYDLDASDYSPIVFGETGHTVLSVTQFNTPEVNGYLQRFSSPGTLLGSSFAQGNLAQQISNYRSAGEPRGWHAITWSEGAEQKYLFSRLLESNTVTNANPPTAPDRWNVKSIASIASYLLPDTLSTPVADIVIWQNEYGDLQIGHRSETSSNFNWQTSSKLDTSQRLGGKINSRGEAIQGNQIWRNGSWKNLSDFISDEEWKSSIALDINDHGMILIQNPSNNELAILNAIDITVVFGIGPEQNVTSRKVLEDYLETVKRWKTGNIWSVDGVKANGNGRSYTIEIATDQKTLQRALSVPGRVVVFDGHSNFGLGPNFSREPVKTINSFTNLGVGYTDIPLTYFSAGQEPDWQAALAEWEIAHAAWKEIEKNWNEDFPPPDAPLPPDGTFEAQERFESEGFAFLRVQPNEIRQNPLNYIPAPLNGMRFPNDPNNQVGVGQAFALQQVGNESFHYTRNGIRRLMVTAPNTDMPKNLRYRTFFYNACSSGPDYIENFRHGEFLHTTRFCRVKDATKIFVEAIVEGRTAAQTIPLLNQPGVGHTNPLILNVYRLQNFKFRNYEIQIIKITFITELHPLSYYTSPREN